MNKTSARNFYFGKITSLKKGAVNADVKIFIAPDAELSAIITNESVLNLKLKKGKEVYALFKSSSVILTTDENLNFSTRNTIWGKVSNLKKGAINTEVSVDISPGLKIVAVITNESVKTLKLKKGIRVGALVKASQVILATRS